MEFWKHLSLYHDARHDFVTCQWPIPKWLHLLFRWFCALYTLAMFVEMCATTPNGPKILIFLTVWTYIMLMVNFCLRAVAVTYFYTTRDKPTPETLTVQPMSWHFKVLWISYNIAMTGSLMISFMYWAVLYSRSARSLNMSNINAHAINTVTVLIDICITATPVKILHFVHIDIYGLIYGIFSVVYWAAGGTGTRGRLYIYDVMDYTNSPGLAVGVLLGVALVAAPLMHMVVYGLYRLRMFAYQKFVKRTISPTEDQEKVNLGNVTQSVDDTVKQKDVIV